MSASSTDTFLITGAAAGIGAASARLAVAQGAAVALIDRDPAVENLAAELAAASSARARAWICDVGSDADLGAAISAAAEALGPPSGLVTSAAIDRGAGLDQLSVATWDQVIQVNLRGTAIACKAVLPHMLERGRGAIVCLSSPLAFAAAPGGSAAYAASKGGVSSLVRSIAVEYGSRGIRANGLLPGPTETELMWAGVSEEEIPRLREIVASEVPAGRLASPEEIARVAIWLLSEDASYINGAQIPCDGGLLAKAAISQ